jgi:hypothetical protein
MADPTVEAPDLDASAPGQAAAGRSVAGVTSGRLVTPRLLAFYRDVWDDDGAATGWQTIAWALQLADGSAVTISTEPPVAVTMWHNLDDAATALDAYIDTLAPTRRVASGPAQSGGDVA